MITEQLNNTQNSHNNNYKKEYYGIEALTQPLFDIEGLKEISHWLIYRSNDNEIQILELNNKSLENSQQLYLYFEHSKPHLNADKSVISGFDLFNYVNDLQSRYKIEIEYHKNNITKCKILN